jgi:hypothetical protein
MAVLPKVRITFLCGLIAIVLLAAGCQRDDGVIPTLANPDAVATGFVLTEYAPPAGFETVSFPRIDDNLEELPGWRYEMEFEFHGRFARTPREASARTSATVSYEQLASSRRVVASKQQDLQGESHPVQYEGVRLGPDTFLVRDGSCLENAGDAAVVVADLSAGDLIGGVSSATTAAEERIINGEQVWRYDYTPDMMQLPNVVFGADSRILTLEDELWVAPEHNAVVRYWLTMEVENVTLLESPLPVSGTLIVRYDVYDIGIVPNINVPFGC